MEDSDLSSLSSVPPSPESKPASSVLSPARSISLSPSLSLSPTGYDASNPRLADRPPSPPHEFELADNPDIAFLVMFRSRFSDAFTTKLGHFGPQDIERGIVDSVPSPQVENFLCALLALVLNRKKPIERGHYGRALEEAILAQKNQWPRAWEGQSPISGNRTFTSMTASERLTLLKTLVLWSLHASETVSGMIRESYKQARQELDLNQARSVQGWGADGLHRIYWLIEGQDDTSFRVYREKNRTKPDNEWINVAGSIDELRILVEKLRDDGAQQARRLADRINNSIPRFGATEEKRKRREYRVARRAQFARPEPGFSLYEGRTRGKRMRYTFDEEEDDYTSDALSTRRSTRQSGAATPAEPTVTASGRQVRTRIGGRYGEQQTGGRESVDRTTPLSGEYEQSNHSEEPAAANEDTVTYYKPSGRGWKGWAIAEDTGDDSGNIHGYNAVDAMEEDEDEAPSSGDSAGDWSGGSDNESDVVRARDADDEDEGAEEEEEGSDDDFDSAPKSLVVTLNYGKNKAIDRVPTAQQQPALDGGNELPAPAQSVPPKQETSSLMRQEPRLDTPAADSHVVPHSVPQTAAEPTQNVKTAAAMMLTPPESKSQLPSVLAPSHPTEHLAIPPKADSAALTPSPTPVNTQPAAQFPASGPSNGHPPTQALVNGNGPPSQLRQQTLDGLFARKSPTIGTEGAAKPFPNPSTPPVTSA